MKNNERTNPMISDDEKFELLFKGLIETRDAVLFAVNDYSRPFQTSKEDDEKAINAEKNGTILSEPISNLDPTEKDAVSKYLYLKETLQSLPIEEKKLFIGEYLDRFLERRESEKALGFSKDKDGKFEFPRSFAGFLKRKADPKENKKQDINAYWLSLKEENKNKLIDEFCTTKEGKVNEAAINEIVNSYDGFSSEEGHRRLKEVISYATQKLEEQSKKEYEEQSKKEYDILTHPVKNFTMLAAAAFSMFASSAAAENTTKFPTTSPSESPTSGGFSQSHRPSKNPTCKPTIRPSLRPTVTPSQNPTSQPSGAPTNHPTYKDNNPNFEIPSGDPTSQPLLTPSDQPISQPTGSPSSQPTGSPTYQTLLTPSDQPISQPTGSPSSQPTGSPTSQPLLTPSDQPISQPTGSPSSQPTGSPSSQPTGSPSSQPTGSPTSQPLLTPSDQPISQPTGSPSSQPTGSPTSQPLLTPSDQPISQPTGSPSSQPTGSPSSQTTGSPSSQPTGSPTYQTLLTPSAQPSDQPTGSPSSQLLLTPSAQPSNKTFDYLNTTSLMPTSAPNNPAITDNKISDSTTIAASVVGGLATLGLLVYALKKSFCNTSPSSSPKKASGIATLAPLEDQQGRI